MKLQGTITALVTQFKENGDVDYDAFRTHVRDQIKNGINGIVPLGTTGEAPTIEHDEKEQIIKISVQEAKGKIPVIVGTGSNSTKKTIEETAMAARLGADAVLIVSPYYNKPTQEGIYRHFEAVTKAVNIPVVVYNIKGRTGVNIETSTMKRLAGLKNIIAVKEASGDINQMGDVINELPKSFTVLSGDDSMTLPLMALGGKGVISVISNLFPEKTTELTSAALKGDWEKARKIHYELLPFMKIAFIETNPIPIKTAMNLCGWKGGSFRLPMCEMQPQNKEKLAAVLKSMGVMK
ncbi:MAG TPA: 4-hydroxy-tetrahydrodipicolinate synthase [Candidatus Nanoarchaeia archaeon]|nr:4-hydroxy-tetrahydrodipicolinate synthase [Candidatus Nanoarchaeia archaeon]